MTQVVVTGIGAVTPIGNTFGDSWESVKGGRSGIGPVTRFDISDLPWKVAGELRDFDDTAFLDSRERRRLDLFVRYAVAASAMAADDAGLLIRPYGSAGPVCDISDEYLSSGGVLIGSSRGGIVMLEEASAVAGHGRRGRPSPFLMSSTTISMASSLAAGKLGMRGHCLGISNACASGAAAIGEAYRLIRSGYEGPLLAGGSEAPLCRVCAEGYGASGALSRIADSTASRPFEKSRDGFVLAEGACVMVLEDRGHALRRGARIWGEIIGYANTVDASHMTRPCLDGAVRAMKSALRDAGATPGDIGYINAHGTSTPTGDRIESAAVERLFGNVSPALPVSAVKSMTGHMLAASGAFEAACTLMSLREKIIPPTINLHKKDDDCGLNVVTKKTEADIDTALSNSFGFGGVHAVLVMKGPSD